MEESFVISLGLSETKPIEVPIIYFSATSPSRTSLRISYCFQFAQNDSNGSKKMKAIVKTRVTQKFIAVVNFGLKAFGSYSSLLEWLQYLLSLYLHLPSFISIGTFGFTLIQDQDLLQTLLQIFNQKDLNSHTLQCSRQPTAFQASPNNNGQQVPASYYSNHMGLQEGRSS